MHGKFTAAIKLIVHLPFADEAATSVLEAAFPPVPAPPTDDVAWRCELRRHFAPGISLFTGGESGFIYLGEVFPSGRCQGRSQHCITVGGAKFGGTLKPESETGQTALGSFWQGCRGIRGAADPDAVQPGGMVISVINDFEAVMLCVSYELFPAFLVFCQGHDVGVAEKDAWLESLSCHPFEDGRRTGGAATMEEDRPFRRRGGSISAPFLLLSLSTSIIFAKLSKNLFKNGRLLRHSYEAMQGGPCIEVDKQLEPSLH